MSSSGADGIPALDLAELDRSTRTRWPAGVRRIAQVRVPLTLTVAPKATLYRLPDGRRLWCLRLWDGDRPRPRCVSPERLREYARLSGLTGLSRELAEIDHRLEAAGE